MASPSLALLLFFMTVAVEPRPSPGRDDVQVLASLFGPRLSALILAPPPSADISEGSASAPPPPEEVPPQFFLDILRRSKLRRRGRKSMAGGGRGCFGMKMDRIGSISGLGC